MTTYTRVLIFLLRISLGWLFFYAGWSKVITYFTTAKDWTAAGFLNGLQGPFAPFFASMSGNVLIDYLNAYGLLLVGTTIILGVLVRFSAFWGIVIMTFYFLAGFPPERAFLVDEHIIYALVFAFLAAVGSGRVWGIDGVIEKTEVIKNNSWALKFLG